jgi:hypothetical protein
MAADKMCCIRRPLHGHPFGCQVALAYLCPSQLSLRVGVEAKVDDGQSLHVFVGVLKV